MHDDDAIVASVCDDKVPHVVNGNALRPHELSVAVTLTAEDSSRGAVRMDHKDVVDVEVRYYNVAFVVESNSPGRVKMATQVALVAELAE